MTQTLADFRDAGSPGAVKTISFPFGYESCLIPLPRTTTV